MRTSFGPVLIATGFLSAFGFLWYGVLFQDLQMEAHGYTPADYAGNSPLWYAGGLVISLVIAIGLRHMVHLRRAAGAKAAAVAGVRAALTFGAPLVTYPFVFSPNHHVGLYAVGLGHILIGWPLASLMLGAFSAAPPSGTTTGRS